MLTTTCSRQVPERGMAMHGNAWHASTRTSRWKLIYKPGFKYHHHVRSMKLTASSPLLASLSEQPSKSHAK